MFIKKVEIKNFRLFQNLIIDDLNIPDGVTEGSGLTILVGENGCGKTTILDAISFPLLEYKSDSYSIADLNDVSQKTNIILHSNVEFDVIGLMPKSSFKAVGFSFIGGFRARSKGDYLSSTIVSDQLYIAKDPIKNVGSNMDLRMKITLLQG